MSKIIHIITRLDRGGSAQNTLLTCQRLAGRYEVVLAHGLSVESKMTDWEEQSVERQITKAREKGLKVIPIPSLIRRIRPCLGPLGFFRLYPNLSKAVTYEKHTILGYHGDFVCTDYQGNLYRHLLKPSSVQRRSYLQPRPPAM